MSNSESPEAVDDEIWDMWYCEAKKLVLRAGQAYRFRFDPTCDSCMAGKAKHDKAYGATSDEPLCMCQDRALSQCPGEWEPGCDLGANENFVRAGTRR
jgi:hypothetical protein